MFRPGFVMTRHLYKPSEIVTVVCPDCGEERQRKYHLHFKNNLNRICCHCSREARKIIRVAKAEAAKAEAKEKAKTVYELRDEYFAELRRQGKKPKYWKEIQEEGWREYRVREQCRKASVCSLKVRQEKAKKRKSNIIQFKGGSHEKSIFALNNVVYGGDE